MNISNHKIYRIIAASLQPHDTHIMLQLVVHQLRCAAIIMLKRLILILSLPGIYISSEFSFLKRIFHLVSDLLLFTFFLLCAGLPRTFPRKVETLEGLLLGWCFLLYSGEFLMSRLVSEIKFAKACLY
jgi:hypothetical protein